MKQALGWYWPDHEVHLLDWMRKANPPILDGRPAYQGTKQQAAFARCKSFRTAVDIGAHIGLWSYNLAPLFKEVYAFEPVAEHRECFHENVKTDNVVLMHCALGATNGKVSIATTHGSSGDSKVSGSGDIDLRRLDDFKLRDVDFIKVDAEGYEENIILGAQETIREWKPTIIVEQKRRMAADNFGLRPQGAVLLLKDMGYKVAQELSGDFIMEHV